MQTVQYVVFDFNFIHSSVGDHFAVADCDCMSLSSPEPRCPLPVALTPIRLHFLLNAHTGLFITAWLDSADQQEAVRHHLKEPGSAAGRWLWSAGRAEPFDPSGLSVRALCPGFVSVRGRRLLFVVLPARKPQTRTGSVTV